MIATFTNSWGGIDQFCIVGVTFVIGMVVGMLIVIFERPAKRRCTFCNQIITPDEFTSVAHRRENSISGICQACMNEQEGRGVKV